MQNRDIIQFTVDKDNENKINAYILNGLSLYLTQLLALCEQMKLADENKQAIKEGFRDLINQKIREGKLNLLGEWISKSSKIKNSEGGLDKKEFVHFVKCNVSELNDATKFIEGVLFNKLDKENSSNEDFLTQYFDVQRRTQRYNKQSPTLFSQEFNNQIVKNKKMENEFNEFKDKLISIQKVVNGYSNKNKKTMVDNFNNRIVTILGSIKPGSVVDYHEQVTAVNTALDELSENENKYYKSLIFFSHLRQSHSSLKPKIDEAKKIVDSLRVNYRKEARCYPVLSLTN
jgi:hypothetical protein